MTVFEKALLCIGALALGILLLAIFVTPSSAIEPYRYHRHNVIDDDEEGE